MRSLVLIHGRAQEHKDPVALKQEWLGALRTGLARQGLDLPVDEEAIRFPYYGQALYDLVKGKAENAARVLVRGEFDDDNEREFAREVLSEVLSESGVTQDQIREVAGEDVVRRGPQNWEWFQAGLQALDRFVPGASSATIAVVTHDVYRYLRNPGLRDVIDGGVREAMEADEETVVVAHSLGTVVAYNVLRREGEEQGWRVPLLVTLGSPLGVGAIRRGLAPLRYPAGVERWFNAYDEGDVVALNPLDARHFPVDPDVENWNQVDNHTGNQHGISGYLDDPEVARLIHDALVG